MSQRAEGPAEAAAERLRTVWIVGFVALATRLLYLASHARSPLFLVTVLDARGNELAARSLAGGGLAEAWTSGFRPILYPLLLAPLFRLFGEMGVVAAQVVQHGLGIVTAIGVAVLARRLFADELSARTAGVLFALAPVPLWLEGELLGEAFFLAATTAFLLVAARARPLPAGRSTAAGLLFALAARLRPNAALLLAASPIGFVSRPWRRTVTIAIAWAAVGWAGLVAIEAAAGGSARPWPTAGGPNLYLGNQRGADGLVPRQPFAVAHGEAYRDSVELWASAERTKAGETFPGWLNRTLGEVAADPAGRLALLGRKAVALLWNGEVPNNRSFDFVAREETPWLRWLPGRFGLLLALAAAGWWAAPQGAVRSWIGLQVAAQGASVLLFFVGDRLRAPLVVPLAVLAGGGLVALARRAIAGETGDLARIAAPAALAALVSFGDWTGAAARLPGPERDLHFRSIAAFELGDLEAAEADARRALDLAPRTAGLRAHLGAVLLEHERLDEAASELRLALSAAPGDPRALTTLGVVRERQERPGEAEALYDRALEAAPRFAPARINAAWLALRAGDDAAAALHLEALRSDEADSLRGLIARAALAARRGDKASAAQLEAEAALRDRELTSRLLEELATPLQRPSRK